MNMRSTRLKHYAPLLFVAATLAFTWSFHWPVALAERGMLTLPLPSLMLLFLGGYGPMIMAFTFTVLDHGWAGVHALIVRALRWRIGPIWYAVVLGGPLLLHLAAMGLHVILGGQPPHPGDLAQRLPRVLIMSLAMLPLGPLGEEFGWRGYLLPALQLQLSAFTTSVIIGVVWALWHLPLTWMPTQAVSHISFPLFVVSLAGLSIFYTWLSNNTRGNLLVAILLHAELNVMTNLWQVLPNAPSAARILMLLSLVGTGLSLLLILVYGPSTLARQPRPELQLAASTSQPVESK